MAKNNDNIIDMITEDREKRRRKSGLRTFTKVAIKSVAVEVGAIENYAIGFGVSVLFGRKAGLVTMGVIMGCGILTKVARNIDDIIED